MNERREAPLPTLHASWFFFRDPDAPTWQKVALLFPLIYLVMPLDVIPDAIPLFGWLDDLGLMTLGTLFAAIVLAPYRRGGPAGVAQQRITTPDRLRAARMSRRDSRGPRGVIQTTGVEIG